MSDADLKYVGNVWIVLLVYQSYPTGLCSIAGSESQRQTKQAPIVTVPTTESVTNPELDQSIYVFYLTIYFSITDQCLNLVDSFL